MLLRPDGAAQLMMLVFFAHSAPLQDNIGRPVPMRDVTLRGTIDPETRVLSGKVVAVIGTPLGRIPITGNLRAKIDCKGQFAGTLSYSRVVRLLAAIKRVDLITQLDGDVIDTLELTPVRVASDNRSGADVPVAFQSPCTPLSADTVQGTAFVERTVLRGALTVTSDSVHFVGPAWMGGDSTYHSVVRVTRGQRVIELRINMYERGHKR